ncbi:MAG: tail fiber domain-containing protein [Pseudomonadota bacterium]
MLSTRILIFTALFLGLATAVANVEADALVTDFDGSTLQWTAQAPHGGAVLNLVQPDGQAVRYEFVPGEAINLDLITAASESGQYLFELTLLPELTAEQQGLLNRGRASRQSIDLGITAVRQQGAFRKVGNEWLMGSLSNESPRDGDQLPGDEGIDQTFAEDVEIQGSLCVGFDCTTSESFGFDTVRIKENNLRIHFDDTSSSASFSSRDWRIAINGTQNGDPDFFAIQDATQGTTPFQIAGGAPNNSLYVDAAGDVGIGIADAVVELHVRDGDTPTLRLEQDGSSGFQTRIWDLAGNETNFFVRDVNNSSALPFRIRSGAPQNSLYIAPDGRIGVGTENPQGELQVESGDVLIKAGNLGAGTTSPEARLHVVGGDARMDGNTAMGLATAADRLHVADGNAIIEGNVGIGTTTPTVALEVQNGVTGLVGDVGVGLIAPEARLHVSGGDVRVDGNTAIGISTPSGRLHVSNGNAIFDDSVGIGNPSPTAALDVIGTSGLVGNVGVGTNTPTSRLHVTGGDVRVDDSMGVGTPVPLARLHVNSGNAIVTGGNLGVGTSSPLLPLEVVGAASISGDVGVGTTSPSARLHVAGGNLFVDGNTGLGTNTPAGRLHVVGGDTVMEGNVGVGTSSPGARLHVAGGDVRVDGNVGVGVATPEARLHVAGGDLRVDGAVYQLSSRAAKTNLTAMDAGRLLNLLASLDLFNWNYSSGSDQGRHFGPTAEEFHALFGLGESDRHISVADMAGVALGAAQALQQELTEKERELEDVRARLDRLERLLEATQTQ